MRKQAKNPKEEQEYRYVCYTDEDLPGRRKYFVSWTCPHCGQKNTFKGNNVYLPPIDGYLTPFSWVFICTKCKREVFVKSSLMYDMPYDDED